MSNELPLDDIKVILSSRKHYAVHSDVGVKIDSTLAKIENITQAGLVHSDLLYALFKI